MLSAFVRRSRECSKLSVTERTPGRNRGGKGSRYTRQRNRGVDRDGLVGQTGLFQEESYFRGVRRRMKIESDHVNLCSRSVVSA